MAEETKQPEIMEGGGYAIEAIERAQIDMQIATAHQYPRSMARFKQAALEMVTLDEETAQSCIYRRPVGKKGNVVEYAEGKSVRMAEIVGACYGNLRVGAQLIEQTARQVRARGLAHDLESNFASACEVVESTVDKNGRPYSERMCAVVAKAALAKARRDATFQVVPGALCKSLEEAARTTAIGTTATLGKRRATLADWINKLGIEPARVWAALGVGGLEEIGLNELETLTGIKTAIKEKDVTLDEAFPPVEKPTAFDTGAFTPPKPAPATGHAMTLTPADPADELPYGGEPSDTTVDKDGNTVPAGDAWDQAEAARLKFEAAAAKAAKATAPKQEKGPIAK